MIKTSETHFYVKTKIPRGLLEMVEVLCVHTGKTRVDGDRTEAEFLVISPRSNTAFVWRTREEIEYADDEYG